MRAGAATVCAEGVGAVAAAGGGAARCGRGGLTACLTRRQDGGEGEVECKSADPDVIGDYGIASMFVQYSVVSPRLRTFTTPEKMPVSVR